METPYVLIKSGMFYAHNSRGYVGRVELAEIYTKEHADREVRGCSGEVIARPVTDFLHDPHGIDSLIERLEAMRRALIAMEQGVEA